MEWLRAGECRIQFAQRTIGDRPKSMILEAVHLCGVASGGLDDPRNALVLCRNHHRAFDTGMFGVRPDLSIAFRTDGPDAAALGVTRRDLSHLAAVPHADALEWSWRGFESL
jgi:hypothetical protein